MDGRFIAISISIYPYLYQQLVLIHINNRHAWSYHDMHRENDVSGHATWTNDTRHSSAHTHTDTHRHTHTHFLCSLYLARHAGENVSTQANSHQALGNTIHTYSTVGATEEKPGSMNTGWGQTEYRRYVWFLMYTGLETCFQHVSGQLTELQYNSF